MLFNSAVFFVFALLFFTLWPFVQRHQNLKWAYLVTASFIFYGWWDWRFILLIVVSGTIDLCIGLWLYNATKFRKLLLSLSLFANLSLLGIFKYSGFVARNLDSLFATVGVQTDLLGQLPPLTLILPVGISFYTFQSLSYTIDIYRGQLKPTRNPLHFFSYLALFPQLVAGPIVRAADLLPQLARPVKVSERDRWEGVSLLARGYFKKVVIADNLAPVVTAAFNDSGSAFSQSTLYWWLIMTAFAFQIYYDFSGYSNIARGLARWMGYTFPVNFNHPYVATSLREFWGRWHISLSTWFRDYVYIPLGGSRSGVLRNNANMWITMLLSGLWHGAAWTFILWGGLHAVLLTVERVFKTPQRLARLPGGRVLGLLLVILQVWVSWVFFRAASLGEALTILRVMFTFNPAVELIETNALLLLAIGILSEAVVFLGLNDLINTRSGVHWPRVRPALQVGFVSLLIALSVYMRGSGSDFIYFQF